MKTPPTWSRDPSSFAGHCGRRLNELFMHHRPLMPLSMCLPRLSLLTVIALVPAACFDPLIVEDVGGGTEGGSTTATVDSGGTGDETTSVEPDSSSGEPLPVCGDGVVEGDEVCDDGVNDGTYGGCSADCTALGPMCGDGIVNGGEPCDDGDEVDGNGCNVDCVVSGTVLWTVTYDGPDHGVDSARGVAVDVDDNIIVAGTVATNGNSAAWVRKYTPQGAAVWTQFFPSMVNDSFAGAVVTLDNGDLVFGGGFDAVDGETPDAWLQRISGQGASTWTRTYASPQGSRDQVADLDIDADGYIYALFTEGSRGFVRKYDSEGSELWTSFLDDAIHPWDLATDADGWSVVVGNNIGGIDFAPHITRLNSDGGAEWIQNLEEYDNAYFTTVDVDTQGNVVAGLVSVESDERLLFFDSSGASTGERFPHSGEPTLLIESILLLDDGQSVVSGLKGGDGHLWVSKYSSDGTELWTYTYNGEDWGYGFDVTTSVTVDSNGNIIAVGSIQDDVSTVQDLWVAKLAP